MLKSLKKQKGYSSGALGILRDVSLPQRLNITLAVSNVMLLAHVK